MVNIVQTLGESELNALLGGSDELIGSNRAGPGAIWLPTQPDDEPALLAELANSWGFLEWVTMGAWYAAGSSSGAPSGFLGRYPGMVREVVAESDMKTPRGLKVRAEWCIADPGSLEIRNFMSAVRRARGKGACLTLLPARASVRNWYSFSLGVMGRALMAMEAEGGEWLEMAQQSAARRYLVDCSAADFACVIPLDLHPWGGYVVVAGLERLKFLAQKLPREISGLVQVGWEEVVRSGGGLAL